MFIDGFSEEVKNPLPDLTRDKITFHSSPFYRNYGPSFLFCPEPFHY